MGRPQRGDMSHQYDINGHTSTTNHGHRWNSVVGYSYHCPDGTMVRLVVRGYAPVRLGSSERDILINYFVIISPKFVVFEMV